MTFIKFPLILSFFFPPVFSLLLVDHGSRAVNTRCSDLCVVFFLTVSTVYLIQNHVQWQLYDNITVMMSVTGLVLQ